MIERFLEAGHRVGWVTGDEVYGGNPKLRTALEERGIGYVLAVACSAEVITGAGTFRAEALARKVPKRVWQKLSAGRGAKGQRFYDWAVIDLADPAPGRHQLLIRRNRNTGELAYGAKFPKAVKKITDDEAELLAFYDFPAEHWIHLRTTNPIESTFATVRLRTKVTKGAGSRAAALAMVFKLVESAQARWPAVNAPQLVALVRAGARFERGHLVERREVSAA